MTHKSKIALFTFFAAGLAWISPAARADEWDKKTVLTFNEPVEIPGKVLPAGTYVFKLADTGDRNVVQIFTADEQQIISTVMAIPASRPEPTGNTVVTFDERPAGSPEAIRQWFYPGDLDGFEFVYPKSAMQAAAKSEEPPAPAPPVPPKPEALAIAETPAPEPTTTVVVSTQEVVVAESPADGEAAEAPEVPSSLPDELPQTAGNFAVLPLLGIALFTGGFAAIRRAGKQS